MSNLSIRSMAERMARGKTLWRRLPKEFGHKPILVSPSAALSILKPGRAGLDPMLLRFCDEYVRPEHVVWDIGANMGIFSLAAAQRGAKSLSFEPDVWACSLINKTRHHKQNSELSMEVLCAAVADVAGTASLLIANRGRSANHLETFKGSTQTGGALERQLTPILTLDMLFNEGRIPDVMKIDVETAEVAVLKGAKQVLKEAKPIILVEVMTTTRHEVVKILDDLGYDLTDYETGEVCDAKDPKGSNLLAIPR